jgi:hypothetical protein
MSDDRKSLVSLLAFARRHVAPVLWWTLVTVFGPSALAAAAASTTLQIKALNDLLGFHRPDLTRYLALHMAETRLSDWRFEAAAGNDVAADRIE